MAVVITTPRNASTHRSSQVVELSESCTEDSYEVGKRGRASTLVARASGPQVGPDVLCMDVAGGFCTWLGPHPKNLKH